MNRLMFAALAAALSGAAADVAFAQNTLRPDIAVLLTGPSELQVGLADHFKLAVRNDGHAAASNVVVTMTLPPGATLDTAINTATGKPYFKVPASCSFVNGTTVKTLTCNFASVAVGETQGKVVDFRAPGTGAGIAAFTFTAVTPNDTNAANDSATLNTTYGQFAPNLGLNFPATFTYWVALGKKSVLVNPMNQPSGAIAVDANGDGAGTMQTTPVTWKATKVGNGINVKINSSMYAPAVEWNLTPFNSHCYQGMGYWTGLRDSYEVRACY